MANDVCSVARSLDAAREVSERKSILARVAEGSRLIQSGEFKKAQQVLFVARAKAMRLGIRSANIELGLAIAHDHLMEMEKAVDHIVAALALDPFNAECNNSYRIIADRLRQAVAFGEEQGDGAEVERYYGLLLRIGEADVAAHLVACRHFLSTGRAPDAVRVLGALTVLSPTCAQAWELLAHAAAAVGDAALAAHARIEAVCCHGADAGSSPDDTAKRSVA